MNGPLNLAHSALEKAELLGTPFIPASFRPKVLLQLSFPSTGASVQLGNELQPSDAPEEPVVSFVTEDSSSTYALLSFDPDAPSREDQKFGPWRHLILGGLKPSSNGESLEVQKTEQALSPWVPPSPGKGTGPHRYCFALYKQTKPLLPFAEQLHIKDNERPDRRNFKVAEFAEQNGLELVGFNYFLCENP